MVVVCTIELCRFLWSRHIMTSFSWILTWIALNLFDYQNFSIAYNLTSTPLFCFDIKVLLLFCWQIYYYCLQFNWYAFWNVDSFFSTQKNDVLLLRFCCFFDRTGIACSSPTWTPDQIPTVYTLHVLDDHDFLMSISHLSFQILIFHAFDLKLSTWISQ